MKKVKRILDFICMIASFALCIISVWEKDYSQATFSLILGLIFAGTFENKPQKATVMFNFPYDKQENNNDNV